MAIGVIVVAGAHCRQRVPCPPSHIRPPAGARSEYISALHHGLLACCCMHLSVVTTKHALCTKHNVGA